MKKILLLFISLSVFGQKTETIQVRFKPPIGYERTAEPGNSFGFFLRNLPLKPKGSVVKHFNGSLKSKSNVYDAVVDLPIGNRDLHQCADAVMRLRADYFYSQKQYENIHFNFTNGFKAEYSRWRNGERVKVNGNKTTWIQTGQASKDDAAYWKYLELVFTYAGTASLSKELKNSNLAELKIGDVFIKGGFPGHAVIVVDVAIHKQSKKKIFLLAQSYMPAQEIQILKNNNNTALSPWYSVDFEGDLETPEWTFSKAEFKKF
jgi:Domain of unknown function (4846)